MSGMYRIVKNKKRAAYLPNSPAVCCCAKLTVN
jgi:hypothetical protein